MCELGPIGRARAEGPNTHKIFRGGFEALTFPKDFGVEETVTRLKRMEGPDTVCAF